MIRSASDSGRFLRGSYLALSVASFGLIVLACGPFRDDLWGFHLLSFLPVAASALLALVFVGSAALLAKPSVVELLLPARARTPAARASGGGWKAAFALAVALSVVFWWLRPAHVLLGDGINITEALPRGEFHGHFPITKAVQSWWFGFYRIHFAAPDARLQDVVRESVGLANTFAGFLFVLVAHGLGRVIAAGAGSAAEDSRAGWLVTALLLTQGYMLIYFGYVEHYSFYGVGLAAYLLSALHSLRGRLPLVVPAIACALLLGIHISSFILLPSLALLFVHGAARGRFRDLGLAAAGLLACIGGLNWLLGRWHEGFTLWGGLADMLRAGPAVRADQEIARRLVSADHLRDLLNEHFLLGPFAALLLAPALVVWIRHRRVRTAQSLFLLSVAVSYLASSWSILDPGLGYPRDWDIFAAPAVACTAAGALIVCLGVAAPRDRRALLAALALFSSSHLAAWVLVNHSEARAIERFVRLPLGEGRTAVVLANYYRSRGEDESARRWVLEALDADPDNVNAYDILGLMSVEAGDFETAIRSYRRRVELRPEKIRFRLELAIVLVQEQRHEEALPHLEFVCEREPTEVFGWLTRASALQGLGRSEEAAGVLQEGIGFFEERLRARPYDFDYNLNLGALLARLGDDERAGAAIRAALALRPDSERALLAISLLLRSQDDRDAARPHVEKLARLYPAHPRTAQLVAWLGER